MKGDDTPAVKDLVLVGGGHSHVFVLRSFAMAPLPGVRLTLLSRDAHAPYSGMLPGLIAGHYTYDEAHIDLVRLARFAGARFLHDEVVGIDRAGRRLLCRDRPPLAYDVASVNIGSRPRTDDVAGAMAQVVPVKPIDGFWSKWEALRRRCLERDERMVIAVVGGGAGGVELLLSMQYALRRVLEERGRGPGHLEYCLYTASPDILPGHNRRVRAKFRRILAEREVNLYTEHRVVRVEEEHGRKALTFQHGSVARADEVLWVTTAVAQPWPAEAGLAVDEGGFIKVDATLRSVNDPAIFAAGDVAAMVGQPRPKSGVFAVRQGPPLADNLRRALQESPLRRYRPQEHFLSLISTGDRHAVASRSFWALEGRWVWRWKDRIDRRFMARYSELPPVEVIAPEVASGIADAGALEALAGAPMRCAGCGSKIGHDVLARVLERLGTRARGDVVVGLQAPDDAAVVSVPVGKLLVQSVDYFRAPVDDPFVFGRITANHALGDIWAMGAEPRTALAVVQVPYAVEEKMEEDVFQMLAGAVDVLEPAGVALVGGHTVEGREMALGFAVTAFAERESLLAKGGLRPGQALICTKALGTGALLAADMRRRARGRWVMAALRSMTTPDGAAAAILRRHGVTGLTDVTGFGLIGHLHEMLRASGVDARIRLDRVPALPGALEVIEAGVFSSLQDSNLRLRRAIRDDGGTAGTHRYALIFDPQTAGGLLAGVPASSAEACVEELRAAGYAAAAIGEVMRPVREGGEMEIGSAESCSWNLRSYSPGVG